jgi:nucleotidyltransferase substrate binding protein (TIGR01987 family)
MTLDITPLTAAIQRLQSGYARCVLHPEDDQLRDGVIQRFEYTYELSHKFLKRYLMDVVASPDTLHTMAFQDVIRLGYAHGLLHESWSEWRMYREMRAKTSHAYDLAVAVAVMAAIPQFIEAVTFLQAQLAARI